jgi:hypothetical protein
MKKLICPKCQKEVKIIKFGGGYIAHCCGRILYNEEVRP